MISDRKWAGEARCLVRISRAARKNMTAPRGSCRRRRCAECIAWTLPLRDGAWKVVIRGSDRHGVLGPVDRRGCNGVVLLASARGRGVDVRWPGHLLRREQLRTVHHAVHPRGSWSTRQPTGSTCRRKSNTPAITNRAVSNSDRSAACRSKEQCFNRRQPVSTTVEPSSPKLVAGCPPGPRSPCSATDQARRHLPSA
jgi:hypothetical protein